MSEKLTYKDLWYGDVVIEDNELFNKRHLVNHKQFVSCLNNLGFRVINTYKPDRSDIYGHTIINSDGDKFNIIFETLKHSGSKDNRIRAHINPISVQNFNEREVYLFGAYNSGDEIIYVIGEISDFVNKSKINRNNSSFWIGSIQNIIDTYNEGEKLWYRPKDKVVLQGVISSKLSQYNNKNFIEKFFAKNIEAVESVEFDKDKYNIHPRPINLDSLSIKTDADLPRNPAYKNLAILNANFTCELCGKQDTFETFKGYEYFEGHHLIMYNLSSQSKYDLSLDIPRNIVCLCPECHKKIHLGYDEDIKNSIIQLLLKHKDLFSIYDIDSIDTIFEDYIKHRKKELSDE